LSFGDDDRWDQVGRDLEGAVVDGIGVGREYVALLQVLGEFDGLRGKRAVVLVDGSTGCPAMIDFTDSTSEFCPVTQIM
jgi:hypothetical protein